MLAQGKLQKVNLHEKIENASQKHVSYFIFDPINDFEMQTLNSVLPNLSEFNDCQIEFSFFFLSLPH